MKTWIIEPHDPLIFRDGRPFHATPGARARTLPFPYPSTLVGATRTRAGWTERGFDTSRIDELRQLRVRGPFLVALSPDGDLQEWLFPAPADALLLKTSKGDVRRVWLQPVQFPEGVYLDMPQGLHPVSANPATKEKPFKSAPRFWTWRTLEAWLSQPRPKDDGVIPTELGLEGLPTEERMHVRIDTSTGTAKEEFLFQTVGLSFIQTLRGNNGHAALGEARFYGLALETDASLLSGPDFLGGERRIVYWRSASEASPTCPDAIRKHIVEFGFARLMLATPAYFERGFLPEWFLKQFSDLTVTVMAAALARPVAISGWDMEKKQPKASRRLVPAGSVYFLKLEGSSDARSVFVNKFWLQAISDSAQDRRDGFGLALLGAWDGHIQTLEVPHA